MDDFKFVEFVESQYSTRGLNVLNCDDSLKVDNYGKNSKFIYYSLFRYSQDYIDYKFEDGSKKEYKGQVATNYLSWDIDCDNLDKALESTNKLINNLIYNYDVESSTIRCYFSGSKGFHVILPCKEISEIKNNVSDVVKNVCLEIGKNIEGVDSSIYNRVRIFRIPNTKHEKTGLFKIPLEIDSLEDVTIDAIKELAKTQKKIEYLNDLPSNAKIYLLINKYRSSQTSLPFKKKDKDFAKNAIDSIKNNTTGDRHNSALYIANSIQGANLPDEMKEFLYESACDTIQKKCPEFKDKRKSELDTIWKSSKQFIDSKNKFKETIVNSPKRSNEKASENISHISNEFDPTHGYKMNQLGNMERFLDMFSQDIRYSYDISSWFIWNGKNWAIDNAGKIYEMAKESVEIVRSLAENASEDEGKKLFAFYKKSSSLAEYKALVVLASTDPSITCTRQDFDKDWTLINCQNGTYDCKNDLFRHFDKKDMLSTISPVKYNPGANLELWEDFINHAMSKDVQSFVQTAIGYSLVGHKKEDLVFLFYGPTRTGKTTLLESCLSALGIDGYGSTADITSFCGRGSNNKGGSRPDLFPLIGKKFVITSEPEKKMELSVSDLKRMAGGDRISLRTHHKENVTIFPSWTLFFSTNYKLMIQHDDEAIWERIIVVEFPNQPKEKVKSLRETLKNPDIAGETVLKWIIDGAVNYLKEGIIKPQEVLDSIKQYKNEMDQLGVFLDETCDEFVSEFNRISHQDFWQSYLIHCKQNDIKDHMTRIELKNAMGQRGYNQNYQTTLNGKSCRAWNSIKFKDSDENF